MTKNRVVRGLRDRKNPQARYLEEKRLKNLSKEELRHLKCILRDGHFFKRTAVYSVKDVPIFVTGEPKFKNMCKSCGFIEYLEESTDDFGVSVGSWSEFVEMTTRHSHKRKPSAEEKVSKWRLKMKGMKK